MKKLCIVIYLMSLNSMLFSQNWVNISKTNPNYSFNLPSAPNIMDTLNIRLAWLKHDSTTIFKVLEFKDTPLDTANASFTAALQQTNGDTLLAMSQSIAVSNNFVITGSQSITSFQGYKGLDVSMRYTESSTGKIILLYSRYFYNIHTLLTFSITGEEENLSQLQTDKGLFFSSISL